MSLTRESQCARRHSSAASSPVDGLFGDSDVGECPALPAWLEEGTEAHRRLQEEEHDKEEMEEGHSASSSCISLLAQGRWPEEEVVVARIDWKHALRISSAYFSSRELPAANAFGASGTDLARQSWLEEMQEISRASRGGGSDLQRDRRISSAELSASTSLPAVDSFGTSGFDHPAQPSVIEQEMEVFLVSRVRDVY